MRTCVHTIHLLLILFLKLRNCSTICSRTGTRTGPGPAPDRDRDGVCPALVRSRNRTHHVCFTSCFRWTLRNLKESVSGRSGSQWTRTDPGSAESGSVEFGSVNQADSVDLSSILFPLCCFCLRFFLQSSVELPAGVGRWSPASSFCQWNSGKCSSERPPVAASSKCPKLILLFYL